MSDLGSGARAPALAGRGPALLRLIAALLAAGLVVLLVTQLPLLHWLALGAGWARDAGLAGAAAGALAITLSTLLFAPVVPLIVLSGWIWGVWGALISIPAATASAVAAFSIARALGRTGAARLLLRAPRVAYVIELAERGGLLTVALLRVAPIIPFTPGNAALGLTRLSRRDIALGTPLGLLPGAIFYIWIGHLLPDASAIERGEATRILFERGWLLAALLAAHLVVIGGAAMRVRKLHARAAASQG